METKLSLRKKIALELFREYREQQKSEHDLSYIFWECTLRCNLNCLHCGSDCKKTSEVPDMPIDDFMGALDDIRPIINPNRTTIVLTGGEPLLRKDLESVGKQLYERGFPWGMVSNGLHLTADRLISLLNAGMRSLTISLDGLEQSHNWMRGNPKSFHNALKAIAMAAQAPELQFDVVTCANQRTLPELPKIKNLLVNNGVKSWRLFTIFPIGRAGLNHELQLPTRQFKQLFDFIKEERGRGSMKISYGCEGFLGNYEGDVRDNLFFCRAGVNVASVLIDGSISACASMRSNFTQGNIYNDSFKDVWENRYQNMRNRELLKTGECSSCKDFKYCDGNGLHLRDEKGELLFCHKKRLEEA